ncbi:MAG: dipeptidase, partial [Verrucomicrobiota bacterium]
GHVHRVVDAAKQRDAAATLGGHSAETNSFTPPDPARIAHIKKLLREVPLIDGHNDLPWEFRKRGGDLSKIDLRKDTSSEKLVTDIPRLKAGCVGGQFWSVYIDPEMNGPIAVRAVLEQIDLVHQMIARYPETFELALTADDVERIHRHGKIASLIGMEGGHSIDNSLAMLRMMHRLGARYMTLTHTKNLDWADAAGDKPNVRGLTEFGERVVREMNRLGMMVDVSHVSDDTMAAAIRVSMAPVICSHSSARALCNVPRNVPDDLLKKISETHGVVMVNYVPGFLTEEARAYFIEQDKEEDRLKGIYGRGLEKKLKIEEEIDVWRKVHPAPRPTLQDVANHIDHVRKIAGIDGVGIGADYEGFGHPPIGLEDVSTFPVLLAELSRRGYSDDDLKKIAGKNILRVMRAAEKVSKEMNANQ